MSDATREPAMQGGQKLDISVKVYPVQDAKNLLANASVTIGGCFAIRGVRVMNSEKGAFVSMPQRKSAEGEYMDARLFLGGSEPTTLKELSAALGKETIDMFNTGESRGSQQSHSVNYQKTGHELASVDELAVLDGGKCILQLRGVRPFLSDKYDLTKHPLFKLTADFDKKNAFDIEAFLNHKMRLKKKDVYDVVQMD